MYIVAGRGLQSSMVYFDPRLMKNEELTFSWCRNIDDVSPDKLIPVHRYYYYKGFVKGKQELTSFGGRVKRKSSEQE